MKNNKGFILIYILTIIGILGVLIGVLFYVNVSTSKKYSLYQYEYKLKSMLESIVTSKVSSARLNSYIGDEYVYDGTFYLFKIQEYDENSNIVYCKCLEYPDFVYYQVYENLYTKTINDNYVILEEGYFWEE